MSEDKKFLDIEEQLQKLKDKNLIIPNDKRAKKYLNEIGYYKLINGYKRPFIVKIIENNVEYKRYVESTTIDDLYYLYKFDQDLKALVFKNILIVETMVKSKMSYVISNKYGIRESDYLQANNFKPDTADSKIKFIELQANILNSINEQKTKQKSIDWYAQNYGYYPFWVVSNILTLGTISKLYSKMKQMDQYLISNSFGLKSKMLESILMILQLFRNACAHNEVVYNYKTARSLRQKDIKNIYELYNIEKNEKNNKYIHGTNDIFSLIIIFKLMLDKVQFNDFKLQLKSILKNFHKKVNDNLYNNILISMGIVGDLDILHKLNLHR